MSPELTVQKYVSKDTLNGIVELLTVWIWITGIFIVL